MAKETTKAEPKRQAETKKQAAGLSGALLPVAELAVKAGVKPWELAGLMRACGWADGKQTTEAQFAEALAMFRLRPQGGGRIVVG